MNKYLFEKGTVPTNGQRGGEICELSSFIDIKNIEKRARVPRENLWGLFFIFGLCPYRYVNWALFVLFLSNCHLFMKRYFQRKMCKFSWASICAKNTLSHANKWATVTREQGAKRDCLGPFVIFYLCPHKYGKPGPGGLNSIHRILQVWPVFLLTLYCLSQLNLCIQEYACLPESAVGWVKLSKSDAEWNPK